MDKKLYCIRPHGKISHPGITTHNKAWEEEEVKIVDLYNENSLVIGKRNYSKGSTACFFRTSDGQIYLICPRGVKYGNNEADYCFFGTDKKQHVLSTGDIINGEVKIGQKFRFPSNGDMETEKVKEIISVDGLRVNVGEIPANMTEANLPKLFFEQIPISLLKTEADIIYW